MNLPDYGDRPLCFGQPRLVSRTSLVMDVNSSSSNSSSDLLIYGCTNSKAPVLLSVFAFSRCVLVLPFSVWVMYLVVQRRRRQRCFRTMSHSDVITFHMAVMQLAATLGGVLYLCGFLLRPLTIAGVFVLSFALKGEIMFQVVTCVERYLAVVHPITYLQLKAANGVRIRNVCIGGVWIFSLAWINVMVFSLPNIPVIPFLGFLSVTFTVVSFCSVSVLCVLIRPGPGDMGGDREQIDQLKQKAFYAIVAITGVQWFLFAGYTVAVTLEASPLLSKRDKCLVTSLGMWSSLPSSLVISLLFLLREGKLAACGAK